MHGKFGDWYGTWRGPIEFRSGPSGTMQLKVAPCFAGGAAEVHAVATDADGEVLQLGFGFWWIGDDGLARFTIYGDAIGFTTLTEQPDDPDALAFSGPFPAGGSLMLLYSLTGSELLLSASVLEGYNDADRARTIARLRRVEPRKAATA